MRAIAPVVAMCMLGLTAGAARALDVELDMTQTFTTNPLLAWQFQDIGFDLGQDTRFLDVRLSGVFANDGLYTTRFGNQFFGGYYAVVRDAGMTFHVSPFSVTLGDRPHADYVTSPYSLFISSHKNPALLADITYDDGRFFFTTRWLQLNYMSAIYLAAGGGPLDRGADFKTYGFHLGDFRVGIQDAAVYTGRSFDASYFFDPVPSLAVQYIATQTGSPWTRAGDDNAIMGLFADYTGSPWPDHAERTLYAYAQLLVDDFNSHRFFHPDSYQNPDKVAWSLGGTLTTSAGTIGFYHAGATKYTFEPFGNATQNTNYGYTYYPDSAYTDLAGVQRPIPLEQNYIGYVNGENNLAFMGTYSAQVLGFDLSSSLEFTLSGSKSPANPWHELILWTDGGQGTKFLDDPILEKKLTASVNISRPLGDWIFSLQVQLGYVWNELELAPSPDPSSPVNGIRIFKPSSTNALLAQVAFGVAYKHSFGGNQK